MPNFQNVRTAQRGANPRGLYDPANDHDACGVAFVADMHGRQSHALVSNALEALRNLEHRGAKGADPETGDGVGLLTQVPDEFFRAVVPFELPEKGAYAAGIAFLPTDEDAADDAVEVIERIVSEEGLNLLGWREVPVEQSAAGRTARAVMPSFRQLFVGRGPDCAPDETALQFERRAFCVRKRAEHEADVYFPSLSARTMVYKGMLTEAQLSAFYPDLTDERFASAIGLVHSRFSTNTFPAWPLAHPYRFIAHNGEINTMKGNRNWMRTRESMLETDLIPGDLKRLYPIATPDEIGRAHV